MYKPSSLNHEKHYGMGWTVVPPCSNFAHCRTDRFVVGHSGGAVGASSMLLILPLKPASGHFDDGSEVLKESPPRKQFCSVEKIPFCQIFSIPLKRLFSSGGVVVSMITNLGNVGLYESAFKIAEAFESASKST